MHFFPVLFSNPVLRNHCIAGHIETPLGFGSRVSVNLALRCGALIEIDIIHDDYGMFQQEPRPVCQCCRCQDHPRSTSSV